MSKISRAVSNNASNNDNVLRSKNTKSTIVKTIKKTTNSITSENEKLIINQEIDRPSHYKSKTGKDLIDICQEYGIENMYIFSALKYLFRQGKKADNSTLQDLLKARIYINRYIDFLTKNNEQH